MSGEQPPRHSGMLHGNDAMNMLITIWLDGFTSGAASAASTISGLDGKDCDDFADLMTEGITSDPLAIESVRAEISERMAGTDTGTKTFHVPNPRAQS